MTPRKKTPLTAPTAPCVPGIRAAVDDWRDAGYPDTTETTRILLNHWFVREHRTPMGRKFAYYPAQREAIETLIYLYEVARIRRHRDLLETFATTPGLHILQFDNFARYAIKMATGSGKTKVMSLVMAWQYLNAVAEGRDDYAKTFLVLAPNVIVFDRLRSDFVNGNIFKFDPIVPPELRVYWDMAFYMRHDAEGASSSGALYLTNIQQMYKAPSADQKEPSAMSAVLGAAPTAFDQQEELVDRLVARREPVMVINDEAHHVHDEGLEWNRIVRGLGDSVPLLGQFDFSATPRYQKGGLFTWTVFDYPLKRAILDGVVKKPMKGITTGLHDQPSDIASVRYQAYLTAGVERWREYRDQLVPLEKKPVLFIMLNSTKEADEVGNYLATKYPDLFGADHAGEAQLLVIHTDNSGEVSKKDLDAARDVARRVDESASPVNAIVSVLMLREGWDVQNVTVIVGLRPFTSKANILPEQAVGRGLRKMFGGTSSDYVERVDILGNPGFLKFIEQLEKEEDLALDTFDPNQTVTIVTVFPDTETKAKKDILIPELSPALARKRTLADEIASVDVMAFKVPALPKKEENQDPQKFNYEGTDIVTFEKLIEREYTIPQPQTAEEVISYYAKRIAADVKLPSQFASIVPKVREFLEHKAFGEKVDLSSKVIIKACSTRISAYITIKTIADALRGLVIDELTPELLHPGRALSTTKPFPFSRPTFEAKKTIFNLVAADNEFERTFAKMLDDAKDVTAFAKLPEQFGFTIEYTDSATNLRYYEPDFVAVDTAGAHYLFETKGREDIDVVFKDRAATNWCESVTLLTGSEWRYVKVPQAGFEKLEPDELADLVLAFG